MKLNWELSTSPYYSIDGKWSLSEGVVHKGKEDPEEGGAKGEKKKREEKRTPQSANGGCERSLLIARKEPFVRGEKNPFAVTKIKINTKKIRKK